MKALSIEVRNVQNPALGAALLWRFACGYSDAHPEREPAPLPLLFVVLPIIMHEQIERLVAGTQKASGLRAFAGKFAKSANSMQDLLMGIHDRVALFRRLSQESLRLALATRLLHLEATAGVVALSQAEAVAGIPTEVRGLMKSAEKLGVWCGQLTVHEVASTLKLRF
jgi:hypothetical protein